MSHTQYGIFHPIQKAAEVALETGDTFIREAGGDVSGAAGCAGRAAHCGRMGGGQAPATMYVWAKIPRGGVPNPLYSGVLEETGVVLTPGRAFGEKGEGYVRITLVQPEDRLKEAADRIGRFLQDR